MRNSAKINRFLIPIVIIIVIFNIFFYSAPVLAYTGGISVFPPLVGGPEHKTVSNFDVDTTENNPQSITTGLNYVESVVITTNPVINSHLLISEYPAGDELAFSFTVPKPFQDALVSATINFWGPDVPEMQIWHVHQDEAPVLITATRVEPPQTNSDGNVLWSFTTTKFSDFFTNKFNKKVNDGLPMVYFAGLLGCSLVAIFFFRKA